MQAMVRYLGTDAYGPRESIRAAARYDLIIAPEQWMDLLDARNIAVHVYEETKADEVYTLAKNLPVLVDALLSRVEKKFVGETPGSGVIG